MARTRASGVFGLVLGARSQCDRCSDARRTTMQYPYIARCPKYNPQSARGLSMVHAASVCNPPLGKC
eukprot:1161341-Alexandrium_andersonii.AAC.1